MIEYLDIIISLIQKINTTEKDKIIFLSKKIEQTIQKDGLIYFFGCGHSHIVGEECFYRAGGLANICPIFNESLMLHKGAVTSSRLEKETGKSKIVLGKYNIYENDIMIVVSNSGINGVPVEVAEEGKKRGAFTVGITSMAYKDELSNAGNKKHLYECCNLFINNHCPKGDGSIEVGEKRCAPLSTVAAIAIMNAAIAEAVKSLYRNGFDVPLFVSGNIVGGTEKNKDLIARYRDRVRALE